MTGHIACAACGQQHHLDGLPCQGMPPEMAAALRAEEAEADRLEMLAIARHDATRSKTA